jgi:hypothetical protein
MGPDGFIAAFTIGAVFLAGWVDVRLGRRRPDAPLRRVVHALAAFVVLQLATYVLAYVVHRDAPFGPRLIAFFLMYLPSLVYAFLAGLWLMRTLAEVARLTRS